MEDYLKYLIGAISAILTMLGIIIFIAHKEFRRYRINHQPINQNGTKIIVPLEIEKNVAI